METLNQIMQDTISEKKEKSTFKLLTPFDEVKQICKCGKEFSSSYKMVVPRKEEPLSVNHEMCWECERAEEDRVIVEKIRREQEEIRNRNINSMFDEQSLMNPKLKEATFDNYEPTNQELSKAMQLAKRYADNFSKDNPVSLMFIGNYGTGKSHLSVSITKDLMKKDYTCIFISTPKLMTKIRSTYNKESEFSEEQIIEMLSAVDCLVLDDIGAEATKQNDSNQHTWATSKIFEIIDNRIGKHTIFTSNYPPEELQQRLGGRNFSRMMEDTHVIKMYGEDYRLNKFK